MHIYTHRHIVIVTVLLFINTYSYCNSGSICVYSSRKGNKQHRDTYLFQDAKKQTKNCKLL